MIATPLLNHCELHDWENVYEPSEDSFLLIDALELELSLIKAKKPCLCLEVGSGSGVVITALAMALGGNCHFVSTDINPAACNLTARTASANSAAVDPVLADLAPFLPGSLDLVLFNPPYVPTPSHEVCSDGIARAWAGGIDGREVIDRFIYKTVPSLTIGGLGYLLLLQQNNIPDIISMLAESGCSAQKVASRQIRGESLVVLRFEKVR